jgi:nucleoside-diphosphate-sugar epimerase
VRILVTGAGGVMGQRLVRGLVERGFRVRCLVLPGDPSALGLARLGAELREGNVEDPRTLAGLCEDVHTVYHLAAVIISHDDDVFRRVNLLGTAHVVAAAREAGVRHFIYVSSASVTYPKRTLYAESKLAAERLVSSESSFEHTIVRPTLVYDVVGGQELAMFRDYLERFPIVPFIGDGKALKRPVWAGDVVDGLLRLADNPKSYGKLYNFSGGETISMLDLARLILAHRGKRGRFLHVPVPLCVAAARVARMFMERPPLTTNAIAGIVNDADLDPTEACADLGYRPLGVREGFARCYPLPAATISVASLDPLQRGTSS